jgi:Fe-S-cluster containining protein
MQLADLELYFRRRGDDRIVVPFMPWWYGWIRAQLTAGATSVPCEGCGARCCRVNRIELLPGLDDPAQYRTTESRGALVLDRRADGACWYLDENDRCTIHDRAPMMCRTYDCRVYSASQSVILDDQTNGAELTLSCEAGLMRFVVVPKNAEGARHDGGEGAAQAPDGGRLRGECRRRCRADDVARAGGRSRVALPATDATARTRRAARCGVRSSRAQSCDALVTPWQDARPDPTVMRFGHTRYVRQGPQSEADIHHGHTSP